MPDRPAAAPAPRDVARTLAEIATLLELTGSDPFRARAFAAAARSLEGSDADLLTLARAGELTTLRGIGPAIAGVIGELVLTGHSPMHDQLRAATPIGLFDLMRIPGLGTKRIHTLHEALGIDSLDALEAAARAGRVAALPGFGAKTEAKILAGLAFARAAGARRRYPDALEVAVRIADALAGLPGVREVEIAGALRRRMEVVDEVVLVAAAEEPERIHSALGHLNGVEPVEEGDGAFRARLADGVRLRVRCVRPEAFVPAVVWETGSDAHREGLRAAAAESGLRIEPEALLRDADGTVEAVGDEEAFYAALGLGYVPPELREGLGEIDLARAGTLPKLLEHPDLRGAFHCHTTYSDGKATLEEMAEGARALGWAFLGLGDHSRSAGYARGLSIEAVREQHREVDRRNAGYGSSFRIFKGIESDILPDGSLDYPDEVLATFDYVVGSVHSSFGMSRDQMTSRMLRALHHPALTMLGHPTGRLLLTRAGYDVDVDALIEAAAEKGVIVEINANPHRLDLDWRDVRRAAERGVLIAINPDAHSVAALEHVHFGVHMARKAGLTPDQVINCWTQPDIERYFAERKSKIQG